MNWSHARAGLIAAGLCVCGLACEDNRGKVIYAPPDPNPPKISVGMDGGPLPARAAPANKEGSSKDAPSKEAPEKEKTPK